MNWDDFDAFCQVVDHGGFSAAARALDRPKSSLSASLSRLESALGERLLERTTRQLRLTDAGESLYRDISKPFALLRDGAADALAKGKTVQGTLRVAAPYEFGAHHLARVACRMMREHPSLKVHIDVEHARVGLHERHYDLVFSPLEPSHAPSTVVTRRVYSLERGLFASPELMALQPAISSPEDLRGLPLLAGGEDTHWGFTDAQGQALQVDVRNPRLRSGNAGVRLEAAMAGLGVARITATFCEAAVAQGRLMQLLPGYICDPLRIYALLPGRTLVAAKVRHFLDFLEQEAAEGR
jgi:DNA-binding transcriptional LysR family regulator